ncbi:5-oxoprolinase subunit B family protein [Pseudodonghicola flavimaris]|uniref:Carboxyltransferase domain-containing protein n=1 Tax=Pseudodonghicola flavimaris TaxID=3050036 RepID=A0ABT7F5T3_9RHOB|nr:carboxyltransferase domain-containing protein [Pseudodonghicola flavimaris]MDK3019865.1 carboxyltransferase domain-containing protein [Pseudodonghicola flavimaris]
MLYDALRFYPGGDRAIEIELGDGMDFTINFIVHRLVAAVRAAGIAAIEDLIPELASFQVNYDPDRISYEDLCNEIETIYAEMGRGVTGSLPSRLITIPVLYDDPETTACIAAYRKDYPDKTPDPDLVCQLNGLPDRAALRRRHSSSEYWVAALGFWPGLCSLLPLRPEARIIAPKYNPPRTDTPKGAIGIGGALTCIYPDATPGGYQLIGHTPAPTYDGAQRLPDFQDSLALFRAGDRVRFLPVGMDEYEDIKARVAEGSFRHDIIDYQIFSVDLYLDWAKEQAQAQEGKA